MSALCCYYYFYFGGNKGMIIQRRPTQLASLLPMPPFARRLHIYRTDVDDVILLLGRCRRTYRARLLPVSDGGSFQKEADRWAFRVSGKHPGRLRSKHPKCDRRGHVPSTRRFPSPRSLYVRLSVISGSSRPQYFFETSF